MLLPIPYLIDVKSIRIDDGVSFCIAMLLAIIVNAEGQAFAATLLGDVRHQTKDRHHFNVFLHLNLWGVICFLVAGFGWAKAIDIDATKFRRPRLFLILSRFAGPLANLLMANIAASIFWLFGKYEVEDRVFMMVLVVNLTTAIYNLIPIPPLAGSSIILALFPNQNERFYKYFNQLGPFILICIFLIERLSNHKILSDLLYPIIAIISRVSLG